MNRKRLKLWFIGARPWTYTAALIPVALGSILACANGANFKPLLFILTLLGGICLQAGANFLNTYGDYVSGVDSTNNASRPELVKGEIAPNSMRNAGIAALALGAACGAWPVWCGGWPVLACGAIGIVGAGCYTTGFFPYKYIGLGSILVFFLMGPLMVIPSWYIQGGKGVLLPLLGSLPISFLVMAILHGNELRDIESDRKAGISTLAMRLQLPNSIRLYKGLFTAAYLSLGILIGFKFLSPYALLPLLLLPLICRNLHKLTPQSDSQTIRWLARQTGKQHFLFGTLLIIGETLAIYI